MSFESRCATPIQGQLLRWSERREVAIYLRGEALWVADFIDGNGELIDAVTWFRFNCGTPFTSHARRRMVLESAVPLSGQLAARIEYLHRSPTVQKRGLVARWVKAVLARASGIRLPRILRRRRSAGGTISEAMHSREGAATGKQIRVQGHCKDASPTGFYRETEP